MVPLYQRALRIASELREARSLAEQSRRTGNDLFTTRNTAVHISSALATDEMRFGCRNLVSTHGLCSQLVFGAGTNSQADQPLIDSSADDFGMILLQVMTARAKLHNSEILKSLRKGLSESRRYQNAGISSEKQLRIRRVR